MTADSTTLHLTRILLGIAAAWLCLVVHELGHLAAGLAAGFRFRLFVLGPLMIERGPAGRIHLAWNRDPALFGGVAGTLPTRTDGLRPRFAAVCAGGPVASLLLALAAAAALPMLAGSHRLLAFELKWIRLISAGVFLFNAVPIPNGPFVSDGMRLLRILGRGPVADRELALLTLTALQSGGVRPRAWDGSLILAGLAVRDGSMFECQFHLWSYAHQLDLGRFDEAGAALDRALALAPRTVAALRAQCALESAFFEAAHRRRPEVARAALERVPRHAPFVTESDRLRAAAAVALAEGRARDAADLVRRALACAPLQAAGERAWLEELGAGRSHAPLPRLP